MNICLWFDVTEAPWGGGNTFLRTLTRELIRLGHGVSHQPDANDDIILLNSYLRGPGRNLRPGHVAQLRQTGKISWWGRFVPPMIWLKTARRGPAIVHRLDGVTKVVRGHSTKADLIHPSVNALTDGTIFQSEYCRKSFAEHGVTPNMSTIVINGVDGDTFFPAKRDLPPSNLLRILALSWSPNRRKGFREIAEFSELPGVQVSFVGNWCPEIPPAKVKLLGAMQSTQVADLLRDSDGYLHPAENEPCSNALLEALACGLPVLFKDSGGNREIAGNYGVALSGDNAADIEQFRADYQDIRRRVVGAREDFLIGKAAKSYLSFMDKILATQRETRWQLPD